MRSPAEAGLLLLAGRLELSGALAATEAKTGQAASEKGERGGFRHSNNLARRSGCTRDPDRVPTLAMGFAGSG